MRQSIFYIKAVISILICRGGIWCAVCSLANDDLCSSSKSQKEMRQVWSSLMKEKCCSDHRMHQTRTRGRQECRKGFVVVISRKLQAFPFRKKPLSKLSEGWQAIVGFNLMDNSGRILCRPRSWNFINITRFKTGTVNTVNTSYQ